jgi:hypothetical protein
MPEAGVVSRQVQVRGDDVPPLHRLWVLETGVVDGLATASVVRRYVFRKKTRWLGPGST